MKPDSQEELEFVLVTLDCLFPQLKQLGCEQTALFERNFAGERRMDAMHEALKTHYFAACIRAGQDCQECLDEQTLILQKNAITAADSGDSSFFNDYAFFLKNPLRKYARVKAWLVYIHFIDCLSELKPTEDPDPKREHFERELRLKLGLLSEDPAQKREHFYENFVFDDGVKKYGRQIDLRKHHPQMTGKQIRVLTANYLRLLYLSDYGEEFTNRHFIERCNELGIKLNDSKTEPVAQSRTRK